MSSWSSSLFSSNAIFIFLLKVNNANGIDKIYKAPKTINVLKVKKIKLTSEIEIPKRMNTVIFGFILIFLNE